MSIIQTTAGLRTVLFKELEMYLKGEVDNDHVKSVTKITGAIMHTVAKDLEAATLARAIATDSKTPKSIADLNLNLILTDRQNNPAP